MTKEQMQATGYHGSFGDCYRFLQRYGEVSNKETFWDAAAAEAVAIVNKYEGTPASNLTAGIMLAIYDELERRYTTKYKSGGTQ